MINLCTLATIPSLDAPMLMSDCGSDVSVGSKKDNLLDCNRCAYSVFEHSHASIYENVLPSISFWYKLYSQMFCEG